MSLTLAPRAAVSPVAATSTEGHTAHLRALWLPIESADLVWYVVPSVTSPHRGGRSGADLGHAA